MLFLYCSGALQLKGQGVTLSNEPQLMSTEHAPEHPKLPKVQITENC
jgi:hypothetical protein